MVATGAPPNAIAGSDRTGREIRTAVEISEVAVRPETIRSAARAANLRLEPDDRARIVKGFGWPQPGTADSSGAQTGDADVVVVMGIPGAGKSRHAEDYVARGYVRLNRDDRGGSLRELNVALDGALASGVRRVVLDNTYLTRVARSHLIETAARHGAGARCVWVDTPLAQAQVNLVERLLDRFGSLPRPEELRVVARREPGIMLPASQMRAFRELEPPSADEGFTDVVRMPFQRDPRKAPSHTRSSPGGVFVSAAALRLPSWEDAIALGDPRVPHLVFEWRPGEAVDVLDPEVALLSTHVAGIVSSALCPHEAGVPVCWCRPPLPGLILAFTRAHRIDPSHATLIGASPAHRTLANTVGARYIPA